MQGKVSIMYENGETEFVTIQFDENMIDGYYTTMENIEDSSTNIILNGSTLTLLREPILNAFLKNKFVKTL